MWATAEHDTSRVLLQWEKPTPHASLSLSLACLGSPLSVGQRSPPPRTHTPPLVREMCPRLVGFTLRGRRGPFFSMLLPPQLSAPPGLWPSPPGAPPACGRHQAPPVGSECPLWGAVQRPSVSHPCPYCPVARAPIQPLPLPPLCTAEPRASLGSRRNRLQNASAPSPFAPRAARRPGLRRPPRLPPSRLG